VRRVTSVASSRSERNDTAHVSPYPADVTAPEDDTTVISERLILSPLRPEDADHMVDVLGDERLHEHIGGHPLTLDELRARYRELAAGWRGRTRSG
jgi:hypothetical protein